LPRQRGGHHLDPPGAGGRERGDRPVRVVERILDPVVCGIPKGPAIAAALFGLMGGHGIGQNGGGRGGRRRGPTRIGTSGPAARSHIINARPGGMFFRE
jgi:hypothetical protein